MSAPSSLPFLPALAASLLPDPFYQAITVECAGRDAQLGLLHAYFEYSFREGERTGRVTIAAHAADGAAIWLLPRSAAVDAEESRRKAEFMRTTLGARGYDHYRRIVDYMAPLAERHVPADAWYLSIIGVDPARQGKGLGLQLLRPTLADADRHGVVTWLETFSPRNLAFYRRLGFASAAEYREPVTGESYTIMRREPQTSA